MRLFNIFKNVNQNNSSKLLNNVNYTSKNSFITETNKEDVSKLHIYQFPPISLLKKNQCTFKYSDDDLNLLASNINALLSSKHIDGVVSKINTYGAIIRFSVKSTSILNINILKDFIFNVEFCLGAKSVRLSQPLNNTESFGIELCFNNYINIPLRFILESTNFNSDPSSIFSFGIYKQGISYNGNFNRTSHILIAGITHSGKTTCINSIITSILYKTSPLTLKLMLINPNSDSFCIYNEIPHLLIPVVTDPKKASRALDWAVFEMEKRFQLFNEYNVRDLKSYNKMATTVNNSSIQQLPEIAIFIDNYTRINSMEKNLFDASLYRLLKNASLLGIYIILATDSLYSEEIPTNIKNYFPSKIILKQNTICKLSNIKFFSDSLKLMDYGDMLFYEKNNPYPFRGQISYTSPLEIQRVTDFFKNSNNSYRDNTQIHKNNESKNISILSTQNNTYDDYFIDAGRLVIENEKASIGMLQRVFKIGFNRATRIMDQLEAAGVVGKEEGTTSRRVIMPMKEFEQYIIKKK